MKAMMMTTAIKQAKQGKFKFVTDAKVGNNEIRLQTPLGHWKTGNVWITKDDRKPIETIKGPNWYRVLKIINDNPDIAVEMARFQYDIVGYNRAKTLKGSLLMIADNFGDKTTFLIDTE